MVAAGLIAARLLHYLALVVLFGGALFPSYALGRAERAPFEAWLRRVLVVAGLVALASGVAWFAFTTASMAGSLAAAVDPGALLTVAQSTTFGPLWLARLAAIALAVSAVAAPAPPGAARWLSVAIGGFVLISLAATGRGFAPGGWLGTLHAAADAVHLLAAGVWLGGLAPLAVVLARNDADAADNGRLLRRFSAMGIVAVVALFGSALINGWMLVGSLDRLVSTTCGRLLTAKLTCFLLMLGLAAANRYWITPAFAGGDAAVDRRWLARIRRHVVAEQLLGLAIAALVSVLGTVQPAAEA